MSAAAVVLCVPTDLWTAVSSMYCSTLLRECELRLSHFFNWMALSSDMEESKKSTHMHIANH